VFLVEGRRHDVDDALFEPSFAQETKKSRTHGFPFRRLSHGQLSNVEYERTSIGERLEKPLQALLGERSKLFFGSWGLSGSA
jgi:hypothetical protein